MTRSIEELTSSEITALAAADYAAVPLLRRQQAAWSDAGALATHLASLLGDKLTKELGTSDTAAVNAVVRQITATNGSLAELQAAADQHAATLDTAATEAERLKVTIDELSGEITTATASHQEHPDLAFQGYNGISDGNGGYQAYLSDVADDMRAELRTSSDIYDSQGRLQLDNRIKQFDGPAEWTGPMPDRMPLDTSGYGGPAGIGTGPMPMQTNATVPAGFNQPAFDPTHPAGSDNPVTGGPSLQNPGAGTTLPPTQLPGSTVPPPAPPAGGGYVPPVPVGGNPAIPGGSMTRPAPVPVNRPGSGAMTARPTPGPSLRPIPGSVAGRPPMMGTGGRASVPSGLAGRNGVPMGHQASASKASRALLPNQRPGQAPANRPSSAIGRTGSSPGGIGAKPGAVGAKPGTNPAGTTRPHPGASGATTARPGVTSPGSPNASRSSTGVFSPRRTTVPSVIGGRDGSKPNPVRQTSTTQQGKVFGARVNKGRPKPEPKFRAGSLTKNGGDRRSSSWTNSPCHRRAENLSGKVIGKRDPAATRTRSSEDRLRQIRTASRREFLRTVQQRQALPQHEFLEGLDATVVPDVIAGSSHTARVRRSEVGRVFGTRGWEG